MLLFFIIAFPYNNYRNATFYLIKMYLKNKSVQMLNPYKFSNTNSKFYVSSKTLHNLKVELCAINVKIIFIIANLYQFFFQVSKRIVL